MPPNLWNFDLKPKTCTLHSKTLDCFQDPLGGPYHLSSNHTVISIGTTMNTLKVAILLLTTLRTIYSDGHKVVSLFLSSLLVLLYCHSYSVILLSLLLLWLWLFWLLWSEQGVVALTQRSYGGLYWETVSRIVSQMQHHLFGILVFVVSRSRSCSEELFKGALRARPMLVTSQ